MPYTNIEIKARCSNHEMIRGILKSQNADFKGVDHQVDIYFNVPHGILKLRKGDIENSLIFYKRKNQKDPKQSRIILFENPPTPVLEKILRSSLGTLISVNKTRETYHIGNVRFHLDKVRGLGDFVEIQAINSDGKIGMEKLLQQCNHYMNLLEIKQEDLVRESYSDLLRKFVRD